MRYEGDQAPWSASPHDDGNRARSGVSPRAVRLDPRSDGTGVADAARHYGRAVELRTKAYGPTHPLTLESKNNLAMAMNKGGSPADATKLLEEIVPDRARAGDTGASLRTRGNRAAALFRQGRREEAMLEFDAVYGGFVAAGDKWEALKARMWQARLLMEAGSYPKAEELQREGLTARGEMPLRPYSPSSCGEADQGA
jgi:hypothetical protein